MGVCEEKRQLERATVQRGLDYGSREKTNVGAVTKRRLVTY
jgi:hypothetical protein